MKTLPLVKYCMKNICILWAVNKKKYSICSSKLLMNVSAMCVTVLFHKKYNALFTELPHCAMLEALSILLVLLRTLYHLQNTVFFQLLQCVTLTKMLAGVRSLSWSFWFCFNVNGSKQISDRCHKTAELTYFPQCLIIYTNSISF